MQLYSGSSKQFVEDAVQNRIAEKLRASFFAHFRYRPAPSEVASWRNSLRAMCNVLQHGEFDDHGVLLEYQLPLTSKRLDVMLTGRHPTTSHPGAAIVELKQWEGAQPSSVDECVTVWVGGAERDVLHPSRQVGQYQQYLADVHTAFTSGDVDLASCAYLHNLQYDPTNELYDSRHSEALTRYPLFAGDQTTQLSDFLKERVGAGDGQEVLKTVLDSKYKAGKKLLDHTAAMIKGVPSYVLLDEQRVVFQSVLARARESYHRKGKVAILVKGGPGTGKSVIALNLVGELSQLGYNSHHATGSQAFTETVRKIVGSRAAAQFKYFNSYPTAERDVVDVLVMDEAHRLRQTSVNRFTKLANRSGKTQVAELLHAAKVSVFFIDDLQVVRPGEVGSADLIRKAVVEARAELHEFELEAQFRCNGSDAFVNWVDSTLGVRRTANVLWDKADAFDFQIVDDVGTLEGMIREKVATGSSARLVAGFCWPWSDPGDAALVPDVVLGEWKRPWNAKPDSRKLPPGVPKSHFWASDPRGIEQVGCIYTAQGFEFDYVGVIFGRDLRYDPAAGEWVGERTVSHDRKVKAAKGQDFATLLKQVYRVLLTRGLKGCYVHFMDRATRDFFRSRIE